MDYTLTISERTAIASIIVSVILILFQITKARFKNEFAYNSAFFMCLSNSGKFMDHQGTENTIQAPKPRQTQPLQTYALLLHKRMLLFRKDAHLTVSR